MHFPFLLLTNLIQTILGHGHAHDIQGFDVIKKQMGVRQDMIDN